MAFYTPIVTEVGDKPFICYTDGDMNRHFSDKIMEKHVLNKIRDFEKNWLFQSERGEQEFVPTDTDFVIAFLWTDDHGIYVDVWLNRQIKTYGECGPMKTLQSFNIKGEYLDPWEKGNGCDWTNIVTGREAEHRRSLMDTGRTLRDYVYGSRPDMPEGFIVPWPN